MFHRKKALFYRTLNGAQVGDLFMTLIHTCALNGLNSFDYLVELQRHAAELAAKPSEELPAESPEAPTVPPWSDRPRHPPGQLSLQGVAVNTFAIVNSQVFSKRAIPAVGIEQPRFDAAIVGSKHNNPITPIRLFAKLVAREAAWLLDHDLLDRPCTFSFLGANLLDERDLVRAHLFHGLEYAGVAVMDRMIDHGIAQNPGREQITMGRSEAVHISIAHSELSVRADHQIRLNRIGRWVQKWPGGNHDPMEGDVQTPVTGERQAR